MNYTFRKLVRLAYKNLFRNKRRSLFTIFIATTGFIAMSLTMGYFSFSVYGLQEMTIAMGFSGEGGTGHLKLVDQRHRGLEESYLMEYGIDNYDSLASVLMKQEEIDYLLPRIQFGGLLSNGDKSYPVIGFGIMPDEEIKLRKELLKLRSDWEAGQDIAPLVQEEDGILLGETLANLLSAKVGDYLMLYASTVDGAVNAIDVQVVGTISSGADIVDKFYVSAQVKTIQRLINSEKISQVHIMSKDFSSIHRISQDLRTHLNDTPYSVVHWEEMGQFYQSIKNIFKVIFSFNGIIILSIVLLSCWNIVNMTTMERSREIGTLRALGVKVKYIIQIILTEAFLLGLAGVILGFVLQLILANVINALDINMPPIPGQSRSYQLSIHPLTWYQLPIGLAVVLATAVSGLFSLSIIKKMSIVESLDHA